MEFEDVVDVLQNVSMDIRKEAMALLFSQQHGPSLVELVKSLYNTASFENCLRHFIRDAYGQGQYVLDRG